MRIAFSVFALILSMVLTARGGTFEGLTPGESTRGDAYRVLGQPLKTDSDGLQCWFDAAPFQGKSIEVLFHPMGIMERLKLEPAQAYSKSDYESWFQLGAPSTSFEEGGVLYTLYDAQGVALAQEPPVEEGPVTSFVHFWKPMERYEERLFALYRQFGDAHARKDCSAMRKAWNAGQQEFPHVAQFYLDQVTSTVACSARSHADKNTALAAAQKAASLNPTDESYRVLGNVYATFFNDPGKALEAYSQVNTSRNSDIHFFIGGCYQKLGNPQKAREHLQAYLDSHPSGKHAESAAKALKQLR